MLGNNTTNNHAVHITHCIVDYDKSVFNKTLKKITEMV